jgi:hypothetical protein
MADFEIFFNELIVDTIETIFNGKNILPVLSIDFPKDRCLDIVIEESSDETGSFSYQSDVDWEFSIELLLTGKKYREHINSLSLPSSTTVYFPVNTEIGITCSYFPGSWQDPPDENINVDTIENVFGDEISIDGMTADFNEKTINYFKEFVKKYSSHTDEDLEEIVKSNVKNQLLSKVLNISTR